MHILRHRTPRFFVILVASACAAIATALVPSIGRAQEAPARAATGAQDAPGNHGSSSAQATRATLTFLRPGFDLSWTSGVPDARGDGAAVSGVGLDAAVRLGATGSFGRLRFQFVPEIHLNENRDHQTFPSGDPTRNALASPFYFADHSADLPSRPGDGTLVRAALGETGIWWTGHRAFVGLLATTPQWGPRHPGIEGEGLVLGRSAPGPPRLEAAYAWRPAGADDTIRLRWFTGLVHESDWFDADPDNDSRLLSGARVEYDRAEFIAVGLARTVMSAPGRGTLAAALQPFAGAGSEPVIEMVSADLRLAAADAGTVAWLELARQEPMQGLRGFLRFPTEGIAFRAGLSQRLRRTRSAEWIGSVEFVRLDQSGSTAGVAPNDFYTSAEVVQGWTHRGQPLGSGLGPGGQRQFARLQRVGRTWRLGAFVERARWNEDAMFRQPTPASDLHDVTIQAGIRAERRIGGYGVSARLSGGQRLNYLFQGASTSSTGSPVDVSLFRLGLSFRAAAPTGPTFDAATNDGARRIVRVLPQP